MPRDPYSGALPLMPCHPVATPWPPFEWHLSHACCTLGMVPSHRSPSLGLGDQREQTGPRVAWDGWHWL